MKLKTRERSQFVSSSDHGYYRSHDGSWGSTPSSGTKNLDTECPNEYGGWIPGLQQGGELGSRLNGEVVKVKKVIMTGK